MRETVLQTCKGALKQKAFFKSYCKYFDVVRATSKALREEAFRLRCRVYCEENGYTKPVAENFEYDAYDERAEHYLLMHKPSGKAVGTVRIIFQDPESVDESFPLQRQSDHPFLHQDGRAAALCQISRLCMAPEFRRRTMDGTLLPAYYSPDESAARAKPTFGNVMSHWKRTIPYAPLGLLGGAFEAAMRARIMDCVMMVEASQLRGLEQIGLSWRTLGPQVVAHGKQQPVVFNIKAALDNMRVHNQPCWEVLTDRGRLQTMADSLHREDWHDGIFDEQCREEIYEKLMGDMKA